VTLEQQYDNARSALSKLESSKSSFIREKLSESERTIRAEAATKFDADISAARTASHLAYAAHMAEVEATAAQNAPRPAGTVYVRWERESRGWANRDDKTPKLTATADTAVLEVVTRESIFADNLTYYSRPSIGSLILRLRKKNGELGLKFIEPRNFIHCGWDVSWFPEGHDPNEDAAKAKRQEADKKREEWMSNPTLC